MLKSYLCFYIKTRYEETLYRFIIDINGNIVSVKRVAHKIPFAFVIDKTSVVYEAAFEIAGILKLN